MDRQRHKDMNRQIYIFIYQLGSRTGMDMFWRAHKHTHTHVHARTLRDGKYIKILDTVWDLYRSIYSVMHKHIRRCTHVQKIHQILDTMWNIYRGTYRVMHTHIHRLINPHQYAHETLIYTLTCNMIRRRTCVHSSHWHIQAYTNTLIK